MGAYRLVRKLATGGMAEVFLGKVVGLDGFEKPVAVKRILPHLGEDPIFVSLFLQEAKLTVALQHANVVQVFDLGALRGQYYMVLEFVDGENLRTLLHHAQQRGVKLGLREACFLTQQVAEGLAYAHERKDPSGRPMNVVHRDVNPTNVMVSRAGEVKLADFGIAKATTSQSHTQAGTIKAKTGYMAPEQTIGREPDQRSDVFLLGLLLFELVSGRKLFTETDLIKSIRQISTFDPRTLPPLPGVPPALWDILLRALAPAPEDRCPSAREFSNLLTGFLFDHRLRVGPQDIAALFTTVLPEWRSALELSADSTGEEIQLSSDPPSVSTAPATVPLRTGSGTRPAMTRPPNEPSTFGLRTAGEFEIPAAPGSDAGDEPIKLDRRTQQIVLALLSTGKLAQHQLPEAARRQKPKNLDFLSALTSLGAVTEEDIVVATSEVLKVPYIGDAKLAATPPPKDLQKLVTLDRATRLDAVPLTLRGNQLFCAMRDPANLEALDELKFAAGKTVVGILATPTGLARARERFYGTQDASGIEMPEWARSTEHMNHGLMELELSSDGDQLRPEQPVGRQPTPPPPPPAPAQVPGGPVECLVIAESATARQGAALLLGRSLAVPPAEAERMLASHRSTLRTVVVERRGLAPDLLSRLQSQAAPATVRVVDDLAQALLAPPSPPQPLQPRPDRVSERLVNALFSLAGAPYSSAPALALLAQRVAARLGARPEEGHRIGQAALSLAVASRLQGGEPFAAPTLAPLRTLLGPAFDDLADLLLPAADGNSAAAPTAPGPAAVAAAQLFATAAGTPTPPYESAKSALSAMRQLGWLSAPVLDALSAELTERYTPRPRVLVAGKEGGPLVEVGRMLQGQGFAPRAVRTRLELASLLRDSVALVAEAAHPELGTGALLELRRDPRFAQFPVFLLAGTNEAAAVTRGLEAGADDVFTPPLNEAVLTAKLKRLLQARGAK